MSISTTEQTVTAKLEGLEANKLWALNRQIIKSKNIRSDIKYFSQSLSISPSPLVGSHSHLRPRAHEARQGRLHLDRINYDNIKPGEEKNFEIREPGTSGFSEKGSVDSKNTPYDVFSLLHYGPQVISRCFLANDVFEFWSTNRQLYLPGFLWEWGRCPHLPPWPPWPDLAWTWTPRPPLCDRSGGYLYICVLKKNYCLTLSRWNWRWLTTARWDTRLVQNLLDLLSLNHTFTILNNIFK